VRKFLRGASSALCGEYAKPNANLPNVANFSLILSTTYLSRPICSALSVNAASESKVDDMAFTNRAAMKTLVKSFATSMQMVRSEKQKSQVKADCVCVSYVSTFLSDKVPKESCELQFLCTF